MALHMRAVRVVVASIALTSAGAAYAQAPSNQDLIGAWNIAMTSPQGSHPTTLTISEESGQLAATLTGLPGPSPVAVKTSEAGVTLSFTVDYQGQPVPIVMTGKVTGTDIKGTIDYAGGAAGGDFSGSKAKAEAEAAAANATSLSGTWTMSAVGSHAASGWLLDLAQDGQAVSGTLKNAGENISLTVKGTLENGVLALAVNGEAAGTMKAKLEAGELKDGTYDVGGRSGTWSAARKP